MPVILIAGTGSWKPGVTDWFTPGSPFSKFLIANGVFPVFGERTDASKYRPFTWSTDLGGVGFGSNDLRVWEAAGENLYDYVVPPMVPEYQIAGKDTNLIAHSHGLQVALFACAAGLKVNTLISVGSPIREDMAATAKAARLNIKTWIHIHSDNSDRWQWFGELFDGHFGIVRESPLADKNDFVKGVGHSELLRDEKQFHFWIERGWLGSLKATV